MITSQHGSVRPGTARRDLIQSCTTQLGSARHGSVQPGPREAARLCRRCPWCRWRSDLTGDGMWPVCVRVSVFVCPCVCVSLCAHFQVPVCAEVPGPLIGSYYELSGPRVAGEALQVGVQSDGIHTAEVSAELIPLVPLSFSLGLSPTPEYLKQYNQGLLNTLNSE